MTIEASLTAAEIEIGPVPGAEYIEFDTDGQNKVSQVCTRIGSHVHCH